MTVPCDASEPFLRELEELRNALRTLLDIVIKNYVTSWYSGISPKDRTFSSAVRNTALAYFESIIDDTTATEQNRNDANIRLLELIFMLVPTILERHTKAYRQAKDDSMILCRGDAAENTGTSEAAKLQTRALLVSQRYQVYAPHPGMQATERGVNNGIRSPPTTPEKGTTDIDRPVTPQGIDESLADALSSSITGLPARHPRRSLAKPHSNNDRKAPEAFSDPACLSGINIYAPSPRYLSRMIDSTLQIHLPSQDYASVAERTMITEVMANAVLGNVLRKCSEPWFIWRLGLSLLDEDGHSPSGSPEKTDAVSTEKTDVSGLTNPSIVMSDSTLSSVPPDQGLFSRVLAILMAVSLYLITAASNYLLRLLQTDSKPTMEEDPSDPHAMQHTLEAWLEALMTLASADSAYGTQEAWTMIKMLYIVSSNKADGIAQRMVSDSLKIETVTRLVTKLTDTLFPEGQPAPPIPDATPEEAEAMRQELERRVFERIPRFARFVLFGPSGVLQKKAIANAFDAFSNLSANANLLMTITEAVLVTLVPKVNDVAAKRSHELDDMIPNPAGLL